MPSSLWEHFLRQDKGTLLIEATICVGVAAVFGLGSTSATVAANKVQRTSANFNIASQVAQGALEKAKATPWQQLGADNPMIGVADPLLPAGVESAPKGVLPSKKTEPVQNSAQASPLSLTTSIAVGWAQKPAAGSTYGSKVVVVTTTWYDTPGDPKTMHTASQQATITPGVGEAPPAGVRGSAGGAGAVAPPPTTAAPVPTYTATPVPTTTPPPVVVASPTPTPTATTPAPTPLSPIDAKRADPNYTWLGAATGPETGGLPRGGRYRNYQNGQIIWQADIGAIAMRGGTGFTVRFNNEGGVTGTFGYPLNEESLIQSGATVQTFEQGQMYYKSGCCTTWVPNGPIRDMWINNGGATGWQGFPTAEVNYNLLNGGKAQGFENSGIFWSPNTPASIINGAIRNQFNNMGYERGPLGYPLGVEYWWGSYIRHDFENGYMLWSASRGVEVH